jgi:hypothetical protein
MVKPVLIGSDPKLYWTVGNYVGPYCVNSPGDVQLVQFGYFCMAANGAAIDPALLQLAALIVPGEPYSGTSTDKLSRCILRHQQVRGGTVDGRVSPIPNAAAFNAAATAAPWMLIPLNTHISITLGAMWPNLPSHPACPYVLAYEVFVATLLPYFPQEYAL